jgi:ubiquinone/menaquinone biosynthesis C-methylase UbiE
MKAIGLLDRINRRAVRRLLALTSRKAGACGTQNKANRDAWLEHTLVSIPSGQRILDAGAGELQYKRFCAHLDYVSQDFAQYDGRGDGVALQKDTWDQSQLDIVSDITNIPEPDASFDAVMCIEVLEHLPDPIGALRELTRILKPGGTLILTAPFCSLTHYSPYFYYTGYSRRFYEHWLGELGFEIADMQFNGNYFEYLAQELRRLPWAGKEYASMTVSRLEAGAINVVLGLLNRLSQHNNGSEELLAYGLHIRARKEE